MDIFEALIGKSQENYFGVYPFKLPGRVNKYYMVQQDVLKGQNVISNNAYSYEERLIAACQPHECGKCPGLHRAFGARRRVLAGAGHHWFRRQVGHAPSIRAKAPSAGPLL